MGVQDCMPPKVMELYEKHESEEESMSGKGVLKPSADEPMDEQGKLSCQQPEIQLHGVEPSHKEIVEEADEGVELCKTPRQKPRRKRHRPKVIQEDKTAKALKPATPKLVTPEPARNKESCVERKYTHEKLNIEDPDTPSIAVHEIIGYNYSIAPEKIPDENHKDSNIRVKRKYVRKKIVQNDTALSSDKTSERIGLQNMNLASKTPEQHKENVAGSGQQVKRKYIRKKKCLDDSEIPTDVSETVSTDPKETHVSRSARRCLNFNLEGPSQTIKGNLVSTINHSKSQSQEATLINTISFPTSKSTVQFDPGFQVMVENTPAGVAYDLNRSLNKMLEEYIELPEETILNVENGIGERLTENLKDVVKERDASSCTPGDDGVLQLELQHDQVHYGVDDVPVVLLKENVIEMKVTNREPSNDVQCHAPLFPMIHKKRRTEKGQKDHKTISSRTYSHFKVYTITNLTKSMTVKKSQDKGCALRFDQIEVTTKKRSKMPIRARNSYSLAAIAKALCANTCLKKRSKRSAPKILCGKNLHHIEISYIYDTDSSNKFQKSLYSNSMSQAMVPYVDPVEDITQKLKYLGIDKESEEQEALALCAEGAMIVPVSGPLDLAPTRRPRPKVDLDAETDRVWKLLMWKEGKEESDTLNKNKDKWWEDERQVFHGRVDSFIARMHLVQGDRRFSQWKGSVVDSVVGVFLTQNVSDHLSSSAFMSLAARFPLQSRKKMWELNAERWCKSIIQQDKCIQPFDNMTWHGKMSIPEESNQISVKVHEAKYTEGKMANGEEFLRNDTEGQMQDFQLYEKDIEIDHKTPNNSTGRTVIVEESISLTKDEDSCVEDVMPSDINVVSREGTSYDLTQTDQVGSISKPNSPPELMTGSKCCCLESFSFMDLLQIQDTTKICGHCMYNNKSVPSTESCWQIYAKTQNEVETILTLEKVNDPRQTLLSKDGPCIDSHHDCMGVPHSSLTSCGLGKSSECGEENTSYFSSPDVFNSPKFMDTTERICGHSSELTVEATASMQNRRELDLRGESEQHPVEVSSTIAAQVNSDPHHDCMGVPHSSLTSCGLGKSSECGEENTSYFSSPDVFNSPKFMDITERICGHSSELTVEATASMQNRRELDLRGESEQHPVEVSSTIAAQINSDPHHDCMGMPHNSSTSCGLGKSSECGEENRSYFSSPNVFSSPKFMDTTERICGHSSEFTFEATSNMPIRSESDLRVESDQHPVEVSSTISTQVNSDPHHDCMGMPHTSSTSCGLGKSSECEEENKSYFSSPNVFNSPKFIDTTERICGHSSEFTIEATANMPNRRESDLRVESDQHPVEVSSTIATQVNSDPHHDCLGMPHTSSTSCDLGKLSECGVEGKSYFSSPNVFNSPKFMDTICDHSSEFTIEAAANMPNRRESDLRMESYQHPVEVSSTTNEQNDEMHQTYGKSCNNLIEKSEVEKEAEAYLTDENHISKTAPLETADLSDFEKGIESYSKDENQSSSKVPLERAKNATRGKKIKDVKNTVKNFNWDKLRKQVDSGCKERERTSDTMDSLDWESVRCADVNEISQAIRGRGMNNVLAGRIKEFLNRLVGDHGSIDLEWLRDVEPDEAKIYLLSIRGLGLKSVECVRLLTLQHLAFPVDTNVGRICVRLGWVPLQPLPESLQLHLLELYPVLETIQKYLWPRLCTLDQRTLYELHYQMITFGKVFCTKSKPNCNACPMRGECKHFASAFASARLALPAGEVKSLVTSEIPTVSGIDQCHGLNSRPLPQLEGKDSLQQETASNNCEPIIEEPLTPEPEINETLESEIEDAFYEDPDEIPTIKLNLKEFTQNLQDVMRANNMDLQDSELSKALVTISPEAASIPMPKLKNISRLRTEHQVYELPDSHPLLEEMDQREHDDPSPYLLAIWIPGETAESTQPPELYCNSQATGELCNKKFCFACNSIREARAQTVRATLLIPCRTAMRGSFPLNGTYFQVNEVFADHDSSCNPIDVPRKWIWNLPRRTVYFGTSVTTIFKGLSTEEIQQCFWRGFVCVRGFDRTSRAPKPLYARLHFPASKAPWKRKTPINEE
ncbi:hypothetical protein J5N97_020656 [Dioscorea zingiberensis]|uniref:HhH-GPD domain-containing protein n=1 Tax=Dioscorea zingiberensis TaxID=325984 RepID=A0A9D5CG76_9LILI|nr:hypothetical protein J5N97_020656 [Dioscorea zingiberensis]